MPSLYTSKLSREIIDDIGKNLNITIRNFSIDNILELYFKSLYPKVDEDKMGLFKENLQSRIRGNILMALSNIFPGYVVLSNGNKSELATGYFTLYGDSCGAFNLIKDLFKTEVYALAKWRNENLSKFSKLKKLHIIPQSCINRAPTAELAHNQTDETSLLPYAVLDGILQNLIEENMCYSELIDKFSKKDVDLVLKLLKNSEHKRKQGVIGIKLKNRGFGKEWQYPLTNRFQENDNNN
ncbi:UNVERIFIED_CONTAM: hypothetical protein PYX00_011149 [Menopon gallinae]|uniref:NAD/GMP synthase domain-containing protein n=1 Tax=Menopon gallinae TaxID=328185 RepID=A0AAW2H630_9NEOP